MKPMANAPPLLDIIQSATEPIITVDAQQRIVMFNSAAERVFLCKADRAIGASLDILIPARFRDIHARHVDRFRETGVSERKMGLGSPLWGLRANGEEFPMEASISQTHSAAGVFLSIFLRDITERERVSQALLASRDELTRLSNALLHVREQEKAHRPGTARRPGPEPDRPDHGTGRAGNPAASRRRRTARPGGSHPSPDRPDLHLVAAHRRRPAAHHARRSRTGGGGGMAGVELRLALRHRHRRPDRGRPGRTVRWWRPPCSARSRKR